MSSSDNKMNQFVQCCFCFKFFKQNELKSVKFFRFGVNVEDYACVPCIKDYNVKRDNLLKYPASSNNKYHPTQKPLDMIKKLIRNSSNKGDVVFDAYMGSGTTAIAAAVTGRHYLGFEISPVYHKIIMERLKGRLENFIKITNKNNDPIIN